MFIRRSSKPSPAAPAVHTAAEDAGAKPEELASARRDRDKELFNLKRLVGHLLDLQPGTRLMPPPELRLHVGRVADEANFWRQGLDSSQRVLAVFGEAPCGPVLDWGCGSGRTLNWLGFHPAWREHYRGCDVDAEAIAYIQSQGIAGVAVCKDNPPLPYEADLFEGLFCFSVLTHIPPERHGLWYREMHRVLKPGGRALVTVHGDANIGPSRSFSDEEKALYRSRGWLFSERSGHYKHAAMVARPFTEDLLEGLFEIESYEAGGYHAMDAFVVRKPSRLADEHRLRQPVEIGDQVGGGPSRLEFEKKPSWPA